jgi:hypothetical protein
MDYQICDKCGQNKQLSEFQRHRKIFKKSSNSHREWYYYPTCKECNKDKKSAQDKKYREEHKEEKSLKDKEYQIKNKDKIVENKKQYYLDNREHFIEKNTNYQKEKMENDPIFREKRLADGRERARKNKPIRNKQRKERRKSDPSYKLRALVSKSVWDALKKNGGSKAGISFTKHFFYSMDDLRKHLELLFEPWMNWDNHGNYNAKIWIDNDPTTWTWQIDHIIPHSKFPYVSMSDQEFKDCWALSNLRPYSANQNVIDKDRK